jgi:hypothetical protein
VAEVSRDSPGEDVADYEDVCTLADWRAQGTEIPRIPIGDPTLPTQVSQSTSMHRREKVSSMFSRSHKIPTSATEEQSPHRKGGSWIDS